MVRNFSKINKDDAQIEVLDGFDQEDFSSEAIILTTKDGIKYYFGGNNSTEWSYTRSSNNNIPQGGDGNNAWYLTKIVLPSGKEIVYSYSNVWVNYLSNISQSYSATKFPAAPWTIPYHKPPVYSRTYHKSAILDNISWGDIGEIEFNYSNLYTITNTNLKKLDNIKIINKDDNQIKQYSLNYIEYICQSNYANPDLPDVDQTINRRVFLDYFIETTNNNAETNSYTFSYILPDQMPPRFSYSRDRMGYFNGKANNELTDNLNYNNILSSPYSFDEAYLNPNQFSIRKAELISVFGNLGSDKSPDFEYGRRGLLSQITYPTGGNTVIEYESHNVFKEVTHDPPASWVNINAYAPDSDDYYIQTIEEYITSEIGIMQEIGFSPHVYLSDCSYPPPEEDKVVMFVSIYDITDGSQDPVEIYRMINGAYYYYDNPLNVYTSSNYYNLKVTLVPNHTYKFVIELIRPCSEGGLNFSFLDGEPTITMENVNVPGCRVKKITNNGIYTLPKITKYFYGQIDNLNISSAKVNPYHVSLSSFDNRGLEVYPPEIIINFSSSSIYSQQISNGSHIIYENVTECYGENFENGATMHTFNYNSILAPPLLNDEYYYYGDLPPTVAHGEPISGTPFTNRFGTGEEISVFTYKYVNGEFVKVRSLENTYVENDNTSEEFTAFSIRDLGNAASQVFTSACNIYKINSQNRILEKTISKEYDNNGIETIKHIESNYDYGNSNHFQLSNKTITNSSNKVKKMKYFYPKDFNETVDNFQTLNENNIINKPVKINVLIDDKIVNSKIAKYNNQGQLVELSAYENTDLIFEPIHNPNQLTTIPQYYSAIANLMYDSESNTVKQIDYRNKPSTTVLWGYNYSYVIAIIENAFYSEIESLLPCSYSELQTKSNEELNTIFNTIRDANPQFNITNYTYQPLVGILSITGINGKKTEYDYDSLNRLQLIKNVDDDWIRILKKLEYNYLDF